jgi:quercetin dioxygenase-like cupin family protein
MPYFHSWQQLPAVEVVPGDLVSSLTGDGLQLIKATMAAGLDFGLHSHEAEQFLLVLSGALHFVVGDEESTVEAGGVIHVPSGVPHGGRTHPTQGAVTLEIFAPPREDFRDLRPGGLTYT